MPAASSRDRLAEWFREHAHTLATLDPDAQLSDLEPLREIVGDASVVAVGEGCHFVREFTRARQRVLRFLAEECGFTVLAFEFGLDEGRVLDHWLQGAGTEAELAGFGGTTSSGMNREMALWLRGHNRTGAHPLRFVGVDVPTAGGALRPALDPVAAYLREVDPEALPLVEVALEIADRFTGGSVAVATPRWARLDRADQDALTAAVTRLLLRLRTLEPLHVARGGQERYDLALRRLEAVWHTDYMFGAMDRVFAGAGLMADASVRDSYMAGSVRWYLDRLPSDTRIVLAAHNAHIQKTPVYFGEELATLPAGHYLARDLGADYRALALTHTADQVPEMHPDDSPDVGFSIVETRLGPPGPGSVEAALIDAGRGADITLTDIRGAPRDPDGGSLLDRIRSQSDELTLPVPDAFDGVLSVPTTTTHFTTTLA